MDRELSHDDEPAKAVHRAARYTVLAKAHRWRPILLMQTGLIYGQSIGQLQRAAVAVELLHGASIILDDMPCMDDAVERRGQPTCHKAHGEATASMASTYLTTLAFRLLDGYPRGSRIPELAASTIFEMIGGQEDDLRPATEIPERDREELLVSKTARKTGSLFKLAVRTGAVLGKAPRKERLALTEFAHYLALSYQFLDDLSDADGTASAQGKPAHQDAAQGRMTAVTVYGPDETLRLARMFLDTALDKVAGIPDSAALHVVARMICMGL